MTQGLKVILRITWPPMEGGVRGTAAIGGLVGRVWWHSHQLLHVIHDVPPYGGSWLIQFLDVERHPL